MNEPKPIEVSFEFFPPKTPEAETALWVAIRKLEAFHPSYVSITYGAGGSTQDATLATVTRIARETRLCPAPHLTCVGKTRSEVDEVVRTIGRAGIRHIVALRGDPPGGGTRYEPTPGGYVNAADLVGGIRAIGDFEVSVAVYPEKHPESFTLEVDLAMLAAKVDNGATSALTQFFFDNSAYFRFLDRARARGIDIPIIPGILPVTNFERVRQFAERCGARLTSAFARRFEGLENSPEERRLVAAAVAAEQVTALRAEGVNSFHFYTLNRADVVFAICRMLGLGGDAHMAAA